MADEIGVDARRNDDDLAVDGSGHGFAVVERDAGPAQRRDIADGVEDGQILAQIGPSGLLRLNDQFVLQIDQFALHHHKAPHITAAAGGSQADHLLVGVFEFALLNHQRVVAPQQGGEDEVEQALPLVALLHGSRLALVE